MKKYIIADGGGTKTKYILIDQSGKELCSLSGPGTNPVHVGLENAKSSLVEHINALLEQSGFQACDISAAALFVPVLWRHCVGLEEHLPFPCPILSDTDAALWAALGEGEGLVVLSGTGSFVRGKRIGQELLVGGWGYAFGDEGSGYALGIAALRHAAAVFDAAAGEDELTLSIREHYAIASVDELKALQKDPEMLKAKNVAALCPLLEKAVRNGCPAANEIIRAQGRALATQAATCAARLGLDSGSAVKIGLTGGVLTNNPQIRECYTQTLRERFPEADIFLSEREPSEGAKDYVLAKFHKGF